MRWRELVLAMTSAFVLACTPKVAPSSAAQPNAAKLWVNYLLGREAQDVLMAASSLDHFLVPGSQFASEIARLEAAGTRITNVGVEFVQRNDSKRNHEISTQLQQILRDKP